ncbi:MAG: hypothetical protein ABIA91_03255 [Patescibacteria group bacterium]
MKQVYTTKRDAERRNKYKKISLNKVKKTIDKNIKLWEESIKEHNLKKGTHERVKSNLAILVLKLLKKELGIK